MNFEQNSDSGIMQNTTSAISQRIASMMTRTPAIVESPVKSCVKPRSNPSENCSASVTITPAISP